MPYGETAQVAEIVATPQGFRDWLTTGSGERVVGIRESETSCPFATYLKEGPELRWPAVNASEICWEPERPTPYACRVPTPAWLSAFIYAIDAPLAQRVTAAEALETLQRVLAHLGVSGT